MRSTGRGECLVGRLSCWEHKIAGEVRAYSTAVGGSVDDRLGALLGAGAAGLGAGAEGRPAGELAVDGASESVQVVVDLKPGQPRPPFLVAVMIERDLVLRPSPQDLMQELYLDQPETLQSMGQAWVSQVRSFMSGQAPPPCLAAMSTA